MKLRHFILATSLFSGIAQADTTLTYNNAKGQENSKMYLSDGYAKITNNMESSTALIFNLNENSFTVINHSDKSYMVFGEREIAALGDVSAMVDRMLEEQLAQMPAAQREQMRGMMKSMIKQQMPKQAEPPTYEKNGQSSSYNDFKCDEVTKWVEGKKEATFCVADYRDLGVGADEYASINQFMKVAEKMASQFGQDHSMNLGSIGQVLPVYYDMGNQKVYLSDVNNSDLSPQVFQVPGGYNQASLPKELFR